MSLTYSMRSSLMELGQWPTCSMGALTKLRLLPHRGSAAVSIKWSELKG